MGRVKTMLWFFCKKHLRRSGVKYVTIYPGLGKIDVKLRCGCVITLVTPMFIEVRG